MRRWSLQAAALLAAAILVVAEVLGWSDGLTAGLLAGVLFAFAALTAPVVAPGRPRPHEPEAQAASREPAQRKANPAAADKSDERDPVSLIRSGDHSEAFAALYRRYAGELYGFALNALGDRDTAEHVVQEAFLRAWQHLGSYDPDRGSLRTWLYRLTRHAIIDQRRRAARPGNVPSGPPSRAPKPSPERDLVAELDDEMRELRDLMDEVLQRN